MANPPTPAFLSWLADRLVHIYGEDENVDFVLRLRAEAAKAKTLRTNLSENRATYELVYLNETSGVRRVYQLRRRGGAGGIAARLVLTPQEAADLSRQLDAPIDYFND